MAKPAGHHPWRKDSINPPAKSIPMPPGIGLSPERLAELSQQIKGADKQAQEQAKQTAARWATSHTDRERA